ncbi:MAG: ThuA domain-containing protein [Bacteroidota bacterium]
MKSFSLFPPSVGQFLLFCLIFSVSVACQSLATETQDQATGPSLKDKNVLFVYGGWKGHSPKECAELLVPWMESEGARVQVFDTLEVYTDSLLMDSMDLVVQIWTMGTITKPQLKGLLRTIKNGAGLAGWHGGLGDAFRQETEYQFMVGGQWVSHPGGVIDYEVNILPTDDPVTAGIQDFPMHTEQYYMHVDPNVKVLATTQFNADHAWWIDGCTMPVVWKKQYAKGRVFFISLGHFVKDLETSEVMTMLQRGFRWASESKYHSLEPWVEPKYGITK